MSIVNVKNVQKDIPLVSIVAICYNHSKYVGETLDSILNQTYKNIELIIIDSNSSDNSVQIIEEWINRNGVDCEFIRQVTPHNISQNINKSLKILNGEFFQALSCDDILHKEKIERQVQIFMAANESLSLVYGNLIRIDENSKELDCDTYFEEKGWKNQTDLPSGKIFNEFLGNFIVKAPTVLIRKKHVLAVGGYNETYLFEDVQMWFALVSKYAIAGCFDAIVYYRILPNSLYHSSKKSNMEKEYIRIYSKCKEEAQTTQFQNIYLSLRILQSRSKLLFRLLYKILSKV